MTQEEFAKRVGVSWVTITRWERKNGTMPRAYQWRRLRELWEFTKTVEAQGERFLTNRTRKVEF